MGCQERQHLGNLDTRNDGKCGTAASVFEALGDGKLHGLELGGMHTGGISGKHYGAGTHEADDSTYQQALAGEIDMPVLKEIPGADAHNEDASGNPAAHD